MTGGLNKCYGHFGWKEFLSNRSNVIREYEASKERNQSRPVKTEHGNAGEAALRKWLREFLPGKYGVTSGCIVPDIVTNQYAVYYHDVIIFNKCEAPTLWIDANVDKSEAGTYRAIPAEYVYAVFEVKSRFNRRNIQQALDKLQTLSGVKDYLPKYFFSMAVFFELESRDVPILCNMIPDGFVPGYCGGLILSCTENNKMTGLVELLNNGIDSDATELDSTLEPLVKDVDQLDVFMNTEGGVVVPPGASVNLFRRENVWYVSKSYITLARKRSIAVAISWSYSNFAIFAVRTLYRLAGLPIDKEVTFGLVLDTLPVRHQ